MLGGGAPSGAGVLNSLPSPFAPYYSNMGLATMLLASQVKPGGMFDPSKIVSQLQGGSKPPPGVSTHSSAPGQSAPHYGQPQMAHGSHPAPVNYGQLHSVPFPGSDPLSLVLRLPCYRSTCTAICTVSTERRTTLPSDVRLSATSIRLAAVAVVVWPAFAQPSWSSTNVLERSRSVRTRPDLVRWPRC